MQKPLGDKTSDGESLCAQTNTHEQNCHNQQILTALEFLEDRFEKEMPNVFAPTNMKMKRSQLHVGKMLPVNSRYTPFDMVCLCSQNSPKTLLGKVKHLQEMEDFLGENTVAVNIHASFFSIISHTFMSCQHDVVIQLLSSLFSHFTK